ncbi:MAG: hypothetical protein HY317_04410 [Acidobacteria bacterium]|nr:hypothetical protein [Acidobacteriota bacterium]
MRTPTMRDWTLALAALCLAAPGSAQAPDEAPPPDRTQDSMRAILDRETEPQPGQYRYNPGGRRDPFVSLLKPVEGAQGDKTKKPGMDGFLIQEVALKGIVKTTEGYVAMIVGPDAKAYFPRVGQRLFDGSIVAMDQTSVTFRQEVTDPLSPVRVRDVKKSLYPSEEARQ